MFRQGSAAVVKPESRRKEANPSSTSARKASMYVMFGTHRSACGVGGDDPSLALTRSSPSISFATD